MCGITGFVTSEASADSSADLRRMTGAIAHRGPDAHGFYTDAHAFLGHRRLSIIDVASGIQPMYNEAGNVVIVYNGEIFNHAALRPALEQAGHRYANLSDTETVVHAYEQHGPACVTHFRGMFAFALWDRDSRTLFCARDRLGIKPFYYYWDGRLFAFASEIKALLQHPAISASLEESLIPEYLAFGYTSGEQTLFRGIRKLMPGHHLTLTGIGTTSARLLIRRYWDVPEPPERPETRDDADWIAECRRRLEETVRMRLMSDVPLGMFLSGGVDSSAIAALMKRMVAGPVKTFAVGYREAPYSELSFARRVSEAVGTDHHEVTVGMEDFFNALPRLIWHEDEPVTWPSSVSLAFVSQLAARQVKVVLTGEGSDELFAGYARYRFYEINKRWARPYRVLPQGLRGAVRSAIASSSLLSADLRRKLQHTFLGRGDDLKSLYLDNFYSAFSQGPQAYENFLGYWNARPNAPLLDRLLYADQKTYLVELLMKQDQMSMSASIESRVPFLDHPFVEFASRVPASLKIRNGEAKYIFKKSIEDLLPRDIVYRKKMGFPTPIRQWLLDPKAAPLYDLLRSPRGIIAGLVERRDLDALLDRHLGGREDVTDRIWRLLNLQVWGELFLTGKRIPREGLLAESPEPCLASPRE
ncbi:MAG: asparagine synthase (glutamine-hydrolyzing) [Bryobacteraceae bacterium]